MSQIANCWSGEVSELLGRCFFDIRQNDLEGFDQDLKGRDSLQNSVSNYMKGNE